MKIKKKNQKTIAYILLIISSFVLIFNNMGQFLAFINIPFDAKTQIFISVVGIIVSGIWYLYLEKAIK